MEPGDIACGREPGRLASIAGHRGDEGPDERRFL